MCHCVCKCVWRLTYLFDGNFGIQEFPIEKWSYNVETGRDSFLTKGKSLLDTFLHPTTLLLDEVYSLLFEGLCYTNRSHQLDSC